MCTHNIFFYLFFFVCLFLCVGGGGIRINIRILHLTWSFDACALE